MRGFMAAEGLEKLADKVGSESEAAVHRKSAEIIRLLASELPTGLPHLRIVR